MHQGFGPRPDRDLAVSTPGDRPARRASRPSIRPRGSMPGILRKVSEIDWRVSAESEGTCGLTSGCGDGAWTELRPELRAGCSAPSARRRSRLAEALA